MTRSLRTYRLPLLFGAAGSALCLLPLNMTMTGLCLLLLAAGGAAAIWMRERGIFPHLRQGLIWAMALCVALLTVAVSQIALFGHAAPAPREGGWAVVLGAHVEPSGAPSQILRERLDAALAFHNEHPQIPMILSGGKGNDEPIEEAEAMYTYLQQRGADMRGIYRETEAHTTLENLQDSRALAERLGFGSDEVTVLTNEFHLFRALYLAERLGMKAGAVGAVTRDPFFRINYELREVFSMVKAAAQTANLS